jgi:hypothetical protein
VNNLRSDFVAQLLAEPVKAPTVDSRAKGAAADQSSVSSASAPNSANNDESRANSMLSQAKLMIANGRTDLAADKLNGLIKTYPNTAAADTARKLLATLNSGQ